MLNILNIHPLQLTSLDSTFKEEIKREGLPVFRYSFTLYNKEKIATQSLDTHFNSFLPVIDIGERGIGTKKELFIRARIQLLPSQVLQEQFIILTLSVLLFIALLGFLFYQLKMFHQLREELEERQQIMYSAIHDLKAPLNYAYSLLDIVKLMIPKEEYVNSFEHGKKEIKKLTEIIDSVLSDFKKKDALHLSEFNLPETIRQVKENLRASHPDKVFSFDIVNPENIGMAYLDRALVERCLYNLIGNALKYSDDGVKISVRIGQKPNRLWISVEDTGWGISKEAQKSLGKQFYRVCSQKHPSRKGHGLGLYSVTAACRKMGGKLTWKSEEGKGSMFRIEINMNSNNQ